MCNWTHVAKFSFISFDDGCLQPITVICRLPICTSRFFLLELSSTEQSARAIEDSKIEINVKDLSGFKNSCNSYEFSQTPVKFTVHQAPGIVIETPFVTIGSGLSKTLQQSFNYLQRVAKNAKQLYVLCRIAKWSLQSAGCAIHLPEGLYATSTGRKQSLHTPQDEDRRPGLLYESLWLACRLVLLILFRNRRLLPPLSANRFRTAVDLSPGNQCLKTVCHLD